MILIYCRLGNEIHWMLITTMFQDIFGFEKYQVTKGFKFSDKQKEELKNFVSHEIVQRNYNQILPCFDLNQNFLQIGNIFLSFNARLCLLQDRFDGCLNDEVQDRFLDSINLHNGFTTNKFPDNLHYVQ